jgi:hypothetical protein
MSDFCSTLTFRYCRTLKRVLDTAFRRHLFPETKYFFYVHFFLQNKQYFHIVYPITFDGDKHLARLGWDWIRHIVADFESTNIPSDLTPYTHLCNRMVRDAVKRTWLPLNEEEYTRKHLTDNYVCMKHLIEAYFFQKGGEQTKYDAWTFVRAWLD